MERGGEVVAHFGDVFDSLSLEQFLRGLFVGAREEAKFSLLRRVERVRNEAGGGGGGG